MQVPCMLESEGQDRYIDVLKQDLWIKLLLRTFLCFIFAFHQQRLYLHLARSPILYIYKRFDRAGIIKEKHNSVGRRCKHIELFFLLTKGFFKFIQSDVAGTHT